MDKKQVTHSFSSMLWGVLIFLWLAFTLAEYDSILYINLWMNIEVFIVISILPVFLIIYGLMGLRKNAVKFRIPASRSGKIKLIPMIAGYASMSVAIGLAALYKPEFLPDGATSLHPFLFQGLGLFSAGALIQLMEWIWYYYFPASEPEQI